MWWTGDTGECLGPAGFDDNSAPVQIHNPIDGDRFLRAEMKEAAKKPPAAGDLRANGGGHGDPNANGDWRLFAEHAPSSLVAHRP